MPPAPECFGCGLANPDGLRIEIFRDGDARDPLVIHTEIRDSTGEVLCEADFDYAQVAADRLLRLLELDELPEGYRRHFARTTVG